MKQKRLLVILLILLTAASSIFASLVLASSTLDVSGVNNAQAQEDDETEAEKSKALAAEQELVQPQQSVRANSGGGLGELFIGVDDVTVPAYTVDVTTNDFFTAFVGVNVWGAAYDPFENRVFFNSGSVLWAWPIGGSPVMLGTMTINGAAASMVGLAYYGGTLYGSRNIGTEDIYAIDPNTLVATVAITLAPPTGSRDLGGIDIDPETGQLYGTNDAAALRGLVQIDPDGTVTILAPYPPGETDIDGLAVGGGHAYLVTDQPGSIYVFDLNTMTYTVPLSTPWPTPELFSAGAWIQLGPHINLVKTVGTDPGACATSSSIDIEIGTPVTYCYRVTNTGAVTFTLHDLDDSEFGPILSGFNFSLVPGAAAFLTQTAVITQTTVNTATWTAYNAGPTDIVSDTAMATVTVVPPSISLAKTVGTDVGLCSSENSIAVAINTTVYYCYTVTNTGQTTLGLHDLNDSELGPILSGFNFSLVPGASAFLTQTAVITQTTVNTATWTAYNAGPTDVVSDTDSATVTIFFVPQIEVNPGILSGTQPLNTQVNQTLTISNVGTGDLDWAIDEAEPVNAVASSETTQSILTSTADEAINLVSELGMSLPAGLRPVSQAGGVVDCDAEPDIIIHDDGTIENGYSGNPATGINEVRFVDRFTPSSYPTSFKAVCIAFISLGPTSLNFDIVVYDDDGPGDTPGTQLGSLSAAAVTPVISPPIPPDYQPTWNSYDISSMGISIESGNVYIGVRYTPSAPNVFIAADQSTGNPVGYAGGYWWNNNSGAWTTIQTGFASYRSLFVRPVEGEPTACDLPSDIPWVSVDPTSGTTAEGESSEVTVTYDSTGLSTGVYTGTLCVNSNDTSNPLVTVPLTMTVVTDTVELDKLYLPAIIQDSGTQARVEASQGVMASHVGWAFSTLAALPIMLGILLPYWRYQRR